MKLMVPVLILGLIGIFGAVNALLSLSNNQNSSDKISGQGMDAVVAFDMINLRFQESQKMAFNY